MSLRVLSFEDHRADGEVKHHLERSGLGVVDRRVDSSAEFERALTEFAPDVVLSDRGVSGFAAVDALRMLKASRPQVPFLLVTGTLDVTTTVECLKAGADDVVLKTDLSRLAPAVRKALDLRAGLGLLSPRQVEVLRHVVDGRTTRQIAERLGVSLKTVETHRTEMMKRLDIHDIAGLVRYAVRVRLISPEG